MTYVIVTSEQAEMYRTTKGRNGRAIETFDECAEAQACAREMAMEYQYGVEVIDTDDWTVVE